jgi:eukaryotic-like serine/threonine-protein kinase
MSPEFIALQQAVAGRYSLDRELGRGGMGVVFLARDVALERPVAIKLLPPALARVAGARERFLREARLAARLSHPHIVPIHAVEQHDALAFFVMAFVDGETLGDRVRRAGALPPAALARVLREVAWALGHAHAHGIVHRDVKPENILLERSAEANGVGRALVTDFGIALPTSEATVSAGRGTPAFMSPEQAAGHTVDARSDIYSLGVTAWVAATGALPWTNDGARLLAWEGKAAVPRLAEVAPKVPAPLAAAIERCLAPDRAARWESADALAASLAERQLPTVARLPAPLRRWVRDAQDVGLDVVTSGAGMGSSLAVLGLGQAMGGTIDDIFTYVVFLSVAAIFGALGLTRGVQLLIAAREVQASGFDRDAARAAMLVDEQAHADADEGLATGFTRHDAMLLVASAIGMVKGTWLMVNFDYLGLAGAALAVAAPTVFIRHLARRRGRIERLWRRVIDGPVGRFVFRIGRLGMKAPTLPAPYAGEPTALAVGRAVDHLWAQLPAGDRELLGDVPALVQRLEARALALRAGADADPARRAQLVETVATLEAVRLDLLRLRARQLEAEGMTTTLAQAERVAAYVDEVLTPI